MKDCKHEDPWFGIEQEYFMKVRNYIGTVESSILGFPKDGVPAPQG